MAEYLDLDFQEKALFVRLFGEQAHAVGGCVRDRLLGRSAPEHDLLVLGTPLQKLIAALEPHGRVDLVGRSFGVIKFTIEGRTYDVALPRTDSPRKVEVRGHKDFVIAADPDIPLEKDLERRDFRCNSIALRLSDGLLSDPFDGRSDIQERRIRLTNPAAFPDDPLRVLRAARFAGQLEFEIDPEVYLAARKMDLTGLSVERINEELFRLLLNSRQPSRGLEELLRLDALRQIFPELYALSLTIQDSSFHPETDHLGHHTVWPHTKLTVDQAARLADVYQLERPQKLVLMLAALFHDTGKSETTDWAFKRGRMVVTSNRHDVTGERITRQVFKRLNIFSWEGADLRRRVSTLIRCHHRVSELWQNREKVTKRAYNRLAADVDGEILLLVLLDAADRAGRSPEPVTGLDKEGRWVLDTFEALNVNRETIQPLIMGRDLIPLGVPAGPGMGRLLDLLYQAQLDGEFETREEGLEQARRIASKEAT